MPVMPLRFDILTLFPEMFAPILGTSIPKRAAEKGAVEYNLTNIRDYALDARGSVDDKPFGGGPGMVMMANVAVPAIEAVMQQDSRRARLVLTSPQGKRFEQSDAEQLAREERIVIVCGHYEGFDERIIELTRPTELSIGDYVLSGGELAAMVIVDAVVRLLPGVLGAEDGAGDETFTDGLIEHPQYTRPREYRGSSVPDVLLSGNHAAIAAWRREQRMKRTRERRPDLWSTFETKQNT
jgi:tRNA (guanine37-N1)-methyltransferase